MNNKERYKQTAAKALKNPQALSDAELAFLLRSVRTNPNVLALVKSEFKRRSLI